MKKKLLYIARNIPVPKKKSNDIIVRIAQKLASQYEIDFLFPKEIVPWGFHFLPKHRAVYQLHPWAVNGQLIQLKKYVRFPSDAVAFFWADKFPAVKNVPNPGYDLIHAHFVLVDGLFAFHFSQAWKIPYVVTLRESDLRLLEKVDTKSSTYQLAEKVLHHASYIHVLNKVSQNYLKENFQLPSVFIPHGINTETLEQRFTNQENSVTVKICVVSEAIERKQLDWVIRAVQNYQGAKKLELTFIGDGVLYPTLKKLAAGASNIRFKGRRPKEEVFMHLFSSDIFTLPSSRETFGLVYLEAAAKHNAIIGLQNTGVDGVFEAGREAIFVNTFEEFQAQLFHLIDDDKARKLLAANAFEKVKQMTWAKVELQYLEMYRSVSSES